MYLGNDINVQLRYSLELAILDKDGKDIDTLLQIEDKRMYQQKQERKEIK